MALFVANCPDLVQMLDARVAAEREAHPGRRVTRADVVRELLMASLSRPQGAA